MLVRPAVRRVLMWTALEICCFAYANASDISEHQPEPSSPEFTFIKDEAIIMDNSADNDPKTLEIKALEERFFKEMEPFRSIPIHKRILHLYADWKRLIGTVCDIVVSAFVVGVPGVYAFSTYFIGKIFKNVAAAATVVTRTWGGCGLIQLLASVCYIIFKILIYLFNSKCVQPVPMDGVEEKKKPTNMFIVLALLYVIRAGYLALNNKTPEYDPLEYSMPSTPIWEWILWVTKQDEFQLVPGYIPILGGHNPNTVVCYGGVVCCFLVFWYHKRYCNCNCGQQENKIPEPAPTASAAPCTFQKSRPAKKYQKKKKRHDD